MQKHIENIWEVNACGCVFASSSVCVYIHLIVLFFPDEQVAKPSASVAQ